MNIFLQQPPQSLGKQFVEQASLGFENEPGSTSDDGRIAELERLVGRLTLELEASKKASQLLASPASKNGRSS